MNAKTRWIVRTLLKLTLDFIKIRPRVIHAVPASRQLSRQLNWETIAPEVVNYYFRHEISLTALLIRAGIALVDCETGIETQHNARKARRSTQRGGALEKMSEAETFRTTSELQEAE